MPVVHTGFELGQLTKIDLGKKWETCNPTDLLFAGRLSPEKGIEQLVKALASLVREDPVQGWKLTIAGEGKSSYEQYLNNLAERLGIWNRIVFLGQISQIEIARLLNIRGVVIVPSVWSDPLPRIAIEAMAAGCVVVASDAGGLPEIVEHGRSGILFKADDIRSMSKALQSLPENRDVALSMGQAARKRALHEFSFEPMIENVEILLHKVRQSRECSIAPPFRSALKWLRSCLRHLRSRSMAPNLLLITIDTLRSDYLGCYAEDQSTPSIDQFASGGSLFELAITNGSYTKTAFPPLLSSTYASMYGGPFVDLSSERPMLADYLRNAGYRTAAFNANPLLGAHLGYDAGFDVFREVIPPAESRSWLSRKGAQALLRSRSFNSLLMTLGVDTLPHPVYSPGKAVTDMGSAWLADTTQPFFLWLHYMDSHWPYHMAEDLTDAPAYADAWRDLHVVWSSRGTVPDEKVVRHLKNLYARAVAAVDQQVGDILATLEEQGVLSETIIVLASDHGEAFYEHGRWQHGAFVAFQDELLRVPLIMAGPGIPSSKRIRSLVGLIDVAPTLLEMVGIPIPEEMLGESLVHVLADEKPTDDRIIYSEMIDLDGYAIALRNRRHKYIYDEHNRDRRKLYDLILDPVEQEDVIDDQPEVAAVFELALLQHLKRSGRQPQSSQLQAWDHDEEVVKRLRSLGYVE